MKRWLRIFCLVFVLSASTIFLYSVDNQVKGEQPEKELLSVTQYMKNILDYSGVVAITGIVSDVYPKQKLLVLVDAGKEKQCCSKDCGSLALPVQWAGQMPQISSLVTTEGTLHQENGKMIFVAERIIKAKQQ